MILDAGLKPASLASPALPIAMIVTHTLKERMRPSSLAGHAIELIEILQNDPRPADHLIDTFFRQRRYLGSHDRRELAESVYGVLRHRRRLQFYIGKVKPDAVNQPAWLFAAYKLHFEKTPPETVQAYSLQLSPSEIFDLATLDLVDFGRQNLGLRTSFPEWLVEKLQEQIGEKETEKLLEAMNQPPPLTIRVNTLKTTRENCLHELRKRGHEGVPTPLSPDGIHLKKRGNLFGLDLFHHGWFELQDEGSQIISLLVDPKPNWRVADVCAGGGGKTLHLAARMKNRGEIFAFDVVPERLENLRKRTRRCGIHNVRVQLLRPDEIPANLLGQMDALLIDAPCSGTGVLRRNPDAKWKITPEVVREMAAKQKQIINHYARLLKPGARLVYATCSVLREENEEVVQDFLLQNAAFRPNPSAILQRYHLAHLMQGCFLHLFPHQFGTDGFFAAVLERQR
ncbi:MAG: RsmB/NOP family class I SAM-dependent RNA methyltransferase [candidate division KSB1 bacterium]|nr:RsmB/NOP family class I SAM-dependent RNA methyltransferase [candidate division KSB1 bacterium]MDZ7366723.1 RsmB/NOP family class I SAM-dependent RNA methyltransferase [candidate division KSB1 bacterium]MDZ7404736.1 RsmB/NOP family class I SAM-dependent RNA methyltransferase [candidate division KSB1 bacterium]